MALITSAILTPTNAVVSMINDRATDMLDGEPRVFRSVNAVVETPEHMQNLFPPEYLNAVDLPGLPPHRLVLKAGMPIMMIRNVHQAEGLCNGTRLICRRFSRNLIEAEIANGDHAGQYGLNCAYNSGR